jgi:hypothetical protein
MRLSASKLHLASHCLWPFRFDVAEPERTESEAAARGTAWHAMAAGLPTGSVSASFPDTRGISTEHAYAFDPSHRDAEDLGADCERSVYDTLPPSVITGTADVVYLDYGGILHVRDWKTGRQENCQPIQVNQQLAFLGFCAARAMGLDEVTVELAFVTMPDEPERWSAESDIRVDSWHLSAVDLMVVESTVVAMAIKRGSAEPHPGAHCTECWCPCVGTCPVTQDALATIQYDMAPGVDITTEITCEKHAAALHVTLCMVEAAVAQLRARTKAWVAEHGPITLEDGRQWGPSEITVETVEGPVEDIIAAAHKGITASVSKKSIEESCKFAFPERGAWKQPYEELLARLPIVKRKQTRWETK